MASALQELRKAAGYKSAKDFCAETGIPLATYARYESAPEKIPVDRAWLMADKLGCSIDLIVGRTELQPSGNGGAGGKVQAAYDGLSPQLKQSFDEYLAFLVAKNADEQRRREANEQRRYDVISSRLEQVFLAKLDEQGSDLTVFSAPEAIRRAFQEYVEGRAQHLNEPQVAGSVAKIMAAYDRAHGSFELDGTVFGFAEVDADGDVELATVSLEGGQEGGAKKE